MSLLTKSYLSLEIASRMADKVVATAKANNYAPITVVIIDSAACVVVQKRMGTPII